MNPTLMNDLGHPKSIIGIIIGAAMKPKIIVEIELRRRNASAILSGVGEKIA